MPRKFVSSLIDWKRKRRSKVWTRVQDFEREIHPCPSAFAMALEETARSIRPHFTGSFHTIEKDWEPQGPPPRPEDIIPCRLVEFGEGAEAICSMIAGGHEVPRVSFPAWVLRRKGLSVGSHFNWLVRDPGRVRLADIDVNVPQSAERATVDMKRLEVLHAEMERGLLEDSGTWPVYTGDGE